MLKYCVSLLVFLNTYLISQTNLEIKSTAEKFNSRGFDMSNTYGFQLAESIGDFDGNYCLSYAVPLMDAPDGFDKAITFAFNTNVSHKVFKRNGDDNAAEAYPVNAPEWILGYNGIALQTLNFETNFYLKNYGTNEKEEVPLMTTGYNICNRIPQDIPQNELSYDYINLLRTDGTVISLYNPNSIGKVGTYIEDGIDTKGVAKVTLADPDQNDSLRIIYYKPGDGLTYRFHEEYMRYHGRYDYGNPIWITTFYLDEIYNDASFSIYFTYQFDPENYAQVGRKYLSTINTYIKDINGGRNGAEPQKFYVAIPNLNGLYIDLNRERIITINFLQYTGTSYPQIFDENNIIFPGTKSRFISKLTDQAGRVTSIDYDNNSGRNYEIGNNVSFKPYTFLPKTIIYPYDRKSEIIYDGPINSNYNFNTQINDDFLGRDLSTNYAVKTRTTSDSNGILNTETYNYQLSDYEPSEEGGRTGILTKITQTKNLSGDLSGPQIIEIQKYFTQYWSSFSINTNQQFTKLNKLKKEIVSDGIETRTKEFIWDTGTLSGHYLNGSFYIKEIKETVTKGVNSLIKSTFYSYGYHSIPYVMNYWIKKKLINKETVTDAMNIITETILNSEFIPTMLDEKSYYRIGPPSSIEVKTKPTPENERGVTINKTLFSYYHFPNTIDAREGNLSQKVINAHDESQTTIYSYLDSGYYAGLRSQENIVNGKTVNYQYNTAHYNGFYPTFYEVIPHIKVTKDNQKISGSSTFYDYSIKPVKTEINYDGKQISTYTNYDFRGNLIAEINVENYLSEFEYDGVGRLKKAWLPGSYYSTPIEGFEEVAQRIDLEKITYVNGALDQSKNSVTHDRSQKYPGAPITDYKINYYAINDQPISLDAVDLKLCFSTTTAELSDHQNMSIFIHGVTCPQQNSENSYTLTAISKIVSFQEFSSIKVDVKNIVDECKNNGKLLYGFKLSAWLIDEYPPGAPLQLPLHKWLGFASASSYIEYNQLMQVCKEKTEDIIITYDDVASKKTVSRRKLQSDEFGVNEFDLSEEFNGFGQILRSRVENTEKFSTTYNSFGQVQSKKDALNRSTFMRYDGFGREYKILFGTNDDAAPNQEIVYDLENITHADITGLYETKTIFDENDKKTKIIYDKTGKILAEWKGILNFRLKTRYYYNDFQQLEKVKTPAGQSIEYFYDNRGNIEEKKSNDFGTYTYDYDQFGNLIMETHSGGQTITYSYDGLNRLRTKKINGSIVLYNHYDDSNFPKSLLTDPFNGMPNGYSLENLKGKLAGSAYKEKPNSTSWFYKLYSYDHLGRVRKTYVYEVKEDIPAMLQIIEGQP